MRPLLQRRAAARLVAALLTPFIPELQQQPALAISATTMSGKTRPDTGCVLVNEPRVEKRGKAQIATAELVISDGYVATASFETPWFLRSGSYVDVEVMSKEGGDGAFLVRCPSQKSPFALMACGARRSPSQVSKKAPQGTSSPAAWFSENIFGISGRYGAYGAPQDVKVVKDERDKSVDGGRLLEYTFTASKGNAEVQRRAFVKAMSPPGSRDVVILVAGTTASRWKKEGGEKTSRAAVDSLTVSSAKTSLKKEESSDYRTYQSKLTLAPSNIGGGGALRNAD